MLDRQLNAVLTVLNDFRTAPINHRRGRNHREIVRFRPLHKGGTFGDNPHVVRQRLYQSQIFDGGRVLPCHACKSARHRKGGTARLAPHRVRRRSRRRRKGKSKEIKLDSISLRKMIRKAAFWGALLGGLIASAIALLIGVFLKMK